MRKSILSSIALTSLMTTAAFAAGTSTYSEYLHEPWDMQTSADVTPGLELNSSYHNASHDRLKMSGTSAVSEHLYEPWKTEASSKDARSDYVDISSMEIMPDSSMGSTPLFVKTYE